MVYLIPCPLHEHASQDLSPAIKEAVMQCQVFFVENERSARRFLKKLWREIDIDSLKWHLANKETVELPELQQAFQHEMKLGSTIGIISEAGCPGIADPGQQLVALAHRAGIAVKPLVGPSSITLALMASGLNGQQFSFHGYLPIDSAARIKAIRELEAASQKNKSTHLFIETPYRNNQLLESLLKTCRPGTLLCVAANLTGPDEFIATRTIRDWQKKLPELHKVPAIFLIQSEY